MSGNIAGIDSTITIANGYQTTQNVVFETAPDINSILSTVNVAINSSLTIDSAVSVNTYVTGGTIQVDGNGYVNTYITGVDSGVNFNTIITGMDLTTYPSGLPVTGAVNANVVIDITQFPYGIPVNGSVTVTDITTTNPVNVAIASGNIASIDSTVNTSVIGTVNTYIDGGTVTVSTACSSPIDVVVSGNVAGIDSTINTAIKHSNGASISTGDPLPVTASIKHSNGAIISTGDPLPVTASIINPVSSIYTFNNFDIETHRGWTVSDTLIPVFSVRAKSSATHNVNITNYEVLNNGSSSSTVGYVWIEDADISESVPSWNSLNTEAEYRFYTDAYDSNTPNGVSGGIQRHSGIAVGKNSSTESDIGNINMIAEGVTLTLCLKRLDSATKLDVWVAVDLAILS